MLGITLSVVVLALFVWTGLLSLRLKALQKVGSYWFGVVVASALCTATAVSWVASWVLPRHLLETLTCRAANAAFRVTTLLNPQVSIRGDIDWAKLPPRAVVLLNHTSWMDSVVFTRSVPLTEIGNFRTLLKSTLLQLPVAGFLFRTAGHFPVYFMKDEDGSWSIDKEKQKPVQERLAKFLTRDRAYLSFYPEGQVNKTPEKLMSFRRGSFQMPIDQDIPIFAFVMVGNEETWPANGLPGRPGDIDVRLFPVCEKPSALKEELRSAAALSEHCREVMQKEVDAMRAARSTSAEAKKVR